MALEIILKTQLQHPRQYLQQQHQFPTIIQTPTPVHPQVPTITARFPHHTRLDATTQYLRIRQTFLKFEPVKIPLHYILLHQHHLIPLFIWHIQENKMIGNMELNTTKGTQVVCLNTRFIHFNQTLNIILKFGPATVALLATGAISCPPSPPILPPKPKLNTKTFYYQSSNQNKQQSKNLLKL